MVSDKNTKQEILAEYKRLVAEVKSSGKSIPRSASGMNTKNNKTDIISAINVLNGVLSGTSTGTGVSNAVDDFEDILKSGEIEYTPAPKKKETKSSSKKEDNDLKYLNDEITEKIQALESAKAIKKKEYENILAVEQELVKFVSMINQNKNANIAQKEKQEESKLQTEETLKELQTSADEANQEKLDNANGKLDDVKETIQKVKDDVQKSRAIEEEAYTYKITKAQKEEDDAWADEVAKREDAIAQVESEIAELQAEIDSKATLVEELNAKVEEIPTLIEKAKQDGATQKEKDLGKDYGYKSAMSKKDAEASIQNLTSQIETLKEDYNAVLIEKQAIQEKLDKAYEDSNKLYMQTVQSTGGIKILNNSDKN
jgi:DNA repair exonuclease SbcCD ATPase subunit